MHVECFRPLRFRVMMIVVRFLAVFFRSMLLDRDAFARIEANIRYDWQRGALWQRRTMIVTVIIMTVIVLASRMGFEEFVVAFQRTFANQRRTIGFVLFLVTEHSVLNSVTTHFIDRPWLLNQSQFVLRAGASDD